MDIFIEQLVKKKKGIKEIAVAFAAIIAGLILVFLSLQLLAVPFVSAFVLLIIAGIVFAVYRVITAANLEYEYCFTNGALDIDKIINRRSRRRMAEVNARRIEMMGTNKLPQFERLLNDKNVKKIYACTSVDDDGVYFIDFMGDDNHKMLIFNPNDKIKDGFKRYNPQKVTLDD